MIATDGGIDACKQLIVSGKETSSAACFVPIGACWRRGSGAFAGCGKHGDDIISLNYASCTSLALDPIEKKPLYHFYPGGTILSVGTWGCNLACPFCQNWSISQGRPRAG